MPVHLPPLSRREFLLKLSVLSAALGISPELLAASKPVDDTTWALLADTHIASDPTRVAREINMAEHFKLCSRAILGMATRPKGIIVAGDCALSVGETGDYETFRTLIEPLSGARFSIHLLLGNHDHRDNFWSAFPKARKKEVPDRQASVIKAANANIFLLDSLEKTNSTPGFLGESQLAWLAGELDARGNRPAIVVAHHNPASGTNVNGLKDTEALLEVMRPRKQVKAFVFGHTHRWEITRDPSGIHMINLPPTAYIFRESDPSGWVLCRFQPNSMAMELQCIQPSHPLHGQKVELDYRS